MSSTAPKPTLRLDWCTHAAAKYAVENWHYSAKLPAGKTVRIGVWEDGRFIGCVLYSWGNNRNMPKSYGVAQTQCAELTRVALAIHKSAVSRILAISVRLLKKQSPGLRVLVSYAVPNRDHHGGIYQAAGWVYTGESHANEAYEVDGVVLHKRLLTGASYGRPAPQMPANAKRVVPLRKHRYVMPLDDAMRAQIAPLAKPYPKRSTRAETSTRDGAPVAVGGATPTSALP